MCFCVRGKGQDTNVEGALVWSGGAEPRWSVTVRRQTLLDRLDTEHKLETAHMRAATETNTQAIVDAYTAVEKRKREMEHVKTSLDRLGEKLYVGGTAAASIGSGAWPHPARSLSTSDGTCDITAVNALLGSRGWLLRAARRCTLFC